MITLSIRNQTCHLLAERAVYWEEKKTLILADIHIGKGTVFRKAGISIPQGMMDDDLSKLKQLLEQFKAEKCIIVGDLIHAGSGLSEDVKSKFSQWLNSLHLQSPPVEVHLVLGNHDRALLKALPLEWPLKVYQEGLLEEPFYFSHIPLRHPDWFVWAGHLHPTVEIKNNYDRLVLRCFQVFENLGVLPAYGFFVGGAMVRKKKGCRIYAIAEDVVIEIK